MQAGAFLPHDHCPDIGNRRRFQHLVARIAEYDVDPFALHDLGNCRAYFHLPLLISAIRSDKPVQTGGKLLNVFEDTAFARELALTILEILQARFGTDIIQAPVPADALKHLKDFVTSVPDTGQILAIARPRSTADVSGILALCHEHDAKIVPQGGLTGLAGRAGCRSCPPCCSRSNGCAPSRSSTPPRRPSRCRAGVNLETVQNAAEEAGFFFPLDLGGRGSCQVGGNASTNAGGNRVLRYGMMRESVLGLEAVLADGTVITSLNKMLKNNAGYDLKQLFIGTEGTLGVITRLVLRLHPKAPVQCTGFCALRDYDQVLKLLNRAKTGFGATLAAFETMWPDFYQLGTVGLDRTPPVPLGPWRLCCCWRRWGPTRPPTGRASRRSSHPPSRTR